MDEKTNHLTEGYETGYQATRMALLDINILYCSAANDYAIYVVEYKRWYGTGPGDNRWQRVGITIDRGLADMDIYKYIIRRITEIRKALEDETGISQDVRH